MAYKEKLQTYYRLAKPGIIYGNLLTAAAGFLFASHWHNYYGRLLATLIGLGLIIGCGCVINNIIDIDIDKKMDRTNKRSLVTGDVSIRSAITYGSILGVIGSATLIVFTNLLTFYVAIFGLFAYVVLYGYSKRKSIYGTIIGSIAGAVPPLVGYVSVANHILGGGVALVLILVFWQLAHFYAISLYRKTDYKAAKIPVWSVINGDESTRSHIIASIVIFTLFSMMPFVLGYCGFIYLIIVTANGVWWLVQSVRTANNLNFKDWGRKVFLNSLIVICVISVALAIGPILP
jgi:heme o synthase